MKFLRVFCEYNREHRLDFISLLETRVSGEKVDSIITKLGFQILIVWRQSSFQAVSGLDRESQVVWRYKKVISNLY